MAMTCQTQIISPCSQSDLASACGHVHSFESMGCVDGPGLRFVIFLQGCALRCRYCHNPDTRDRAGGRIMRAEEVIAEIGKHEAFIRHGGVTLSGGEPLLQPAFSYALLHMARQRGWHTALDTSGFAHLPHARHILEVTDLVLLDIKHFDPVAYRSLTSVDLSVTLRFAEELKNMNKPFWLRYVLVPGLTDDLSAVMNLAKHLAGFPNLQRIDVLPFHKMGEEKWERLGLEYSLLSTPEPSADLVAQTIECFKAAGKPVYA